MEPSRWSAQPFKAVYVAYFLATTPIHLVLLALQYSIKSRRPVPAWTLTENVVAALTKKLFVFWTATRSHLANFTAPDEAKERHARVDPPPPPSGLFAGAIAASERVQPAAVDAIWFPRPPPASPAERAAQKVVLHFPGGAFVLAFSHKTTGAPATALLNKHLQADRSIWAQYRLASTPETQFPAAVQDAVTFYHYVLSLGYDAANIIVSGDSAGGNVALALLRYLQTGQATTTNTTTALPLPRGVVLFSPWVHVTATAAQDFDGSPTSRTDVLHSSVLEWGAAAYRPAEPLSTEILPYISPLHHPFALSVPLYIQDGALEGFHDQIAGFAQEMAEVQGNRVRFQSIPLAPHDILFSHEPFHKTKELEDSLDEARRFLWGEEEDK